MQNKENLTSILNKVDLPNKAIISLTYRIILTIYGAILVFLSTDKLKWYMYIIIFVFHLSVFFICFDRNKYKTILRLFNDYFFIYVIFISYNQIDFISISFLFLPILNSQNFSGKKKSILLYIIPLLILIKFDRNFNLLYLIPYISFLSVNSLTKLRNNEFNIYNELNELLDEFITNVRTRRDFSDIFKNIIPVFNNKNFFRSQITDILCFEESQLAIHLLSSTVFVRNYKIQDYQTFFEIQSTSIRKDTDLIINDTLYKKNVTFCVIINETKFFYVFILDHNNKDKSDFFNYFIKEYHIKLLKTFFVRLSKILQFDIELDKEKIKNMKELTEKVTYVNNAVSSMHFVRNKLSPMKNFLAMLNAYDKTSDKKQRQVMLPFIEDEKRKLEMATEEILKRANTILEKSNNPFNVTDTQLHSVEELLKIMMSTWKYYFKKDNFSFKINLDNFKNKSIKFNESGIELVAINWFSNMKKYKSDDNFGLAIQEFEHCFELSFYNNYTHNNNEKLPEFVKIFNSDDRMAILKRNTHGLIEIKDFLSHMDIDSKMICDRNKITLQLTLKKHI